MCATVFHFQEIVKLPYLQTTILCKQITPLWVKCHKRGGLVGMLVSVFLKASVHSFESFTSQPFLQLSFSLYAPMNIMLDFIWTLQVQLRGTRNKWTLQKNLVQGRIRTTNTARPPAYKSTVITTRPQLAWYEWSNKMTMKYIYLYDL